MASQHLTGRRMCPPLLHEEDVREVVRRLEAVLSFSQQLKKEESAPSKRSFPVQLGERIQVGSLLLAHPMSCIFQRLNVMYTRLE